MMRSTRGCLTYVLGTLAIGTALTLAAPVFAADQSATSSWSKIIPAAARFQVLSDFSNAAVLDRETGLVWERAPQVALAADWFNARFTCIDKTVGGRKGWRLPSVAELASLIDPVLPAPFVPTTVFTIVPDAGTYYWSASSLAGFSGSYESLALAWNVSFFTGNVSNDSKTSSIGQVWCVRGEMNADAY